MASYHRQDLRLKKITLKAGLPRNNLTVGRPLHNTRRVRVSLIEVEHDPTGERQTYPAVRPGDEHVYAFESDVEHVYISSLVWLV
jgi:hypothetical protein